MTNSENIFENVAMISTYTAREGVEDGVLVALNGPLYSEFGDAWMPAMVAEAGIRLPVLMTAGAFDDCVAPIGDDEQLAPGQDIKGRLWDVLNLTAWAMRRNKSDHRAHFNIKYLPNVPKASERHGLRVTRRLIIAIGAGDDGPYLTILRPEDD